MSEKASRQSVPVHILGHEYRIRTEADQAAVQKIADLVDQTMRRIRERTGTVDTHDLAVLAALNLANDLLASRESANTGDLDPRRLRALVDRVEATVRVPRASSA